MKATFVVCFLLSVSSCFAGLASVSEVFESISVVDVTPGERIRAIEINALPSLLAPRVIDIKAVEAKKNANGGASIDAVEFVMNTVDMAALGFGYFRAETQVSGPSNNPNQNFFAAAFAFLVRMFVVFEYNETNGDPGFQFGLDTFTGFYNLSHPALQWKPIQVNQTELTDPNGGKFKVFIATMQTADDVFLMRFTATEHPITVGGVKINADTMKVDLQIKWFGNNLNVPSAFSSGQSDALQFPNAQVGVFGGMAAAAGVATQRTNTEDSKPELVFVAGGAFQGFFKWEENAEAIVSGASVGAAVVVHSHITDVTANNTQTVESSFIGGWVVKLLFFSFDGARPSEVSWDPEIGAIIDYNANSGVISSANFILVLGCIVFSLFSKQF